MGFELSLRPNVISAGVDDGVFGGRYEAVETLSDDAAFQTFRAIDRQHGRLVWLGVQPVGSETERQQLLDLAQTLLALVPHPALPMVRDDFFDGDRHVLVRDWVEGTSLARMLAERGDPGLPPSAVQRWLSEAAEILDHLHRQSPPFAHGSVCPAHLVLANDDRVFLVNAGIGVATAESWAQPWTAPEIAEGVPPTPASDIYGLAATGFTLLTGVSDVADSRRWDGIDPALAKVAQRRATSRARSRSRPPAEIGA